MLCRPGFSPANSRISRILAHEPGTFNDPFDAQTNLNVNFTEEEFAEAIVQEGVKRVCGSERPSGNEWSIASKLVELWDKKLPEQQAASVLRKVVTAPGVIVLNEALERKNREWMEARSRYRVLCLSEKPDDLLAWAHYTDCHQGIVLGVSTEHGKPLSLAAPVRYQANYPIFTTLEDLVARICGDSVPLTGDENRVTVKSMDWSYEREWRVIGQGGANDSTPLFHSIERDQVCEIRIGCRAADSFARKIWELAARRGLRARRFVAKESQNPVLGVQLSHLGQRGH